MMHIFFCTTMSVYKLFEQPLYSRVVAAILTTISGKEMALELTIN